MDRRAGKHRPDSRVNYGLNEGLRAWVEMPFVAFWVTVAGGRTGCDYLPSRLFFLSVALSLTPLVATIHSLIILHCRAPTPTYLGLLTSQTVLVIAYQCPHP